MRKNIERLISSGIAPLKVSKATGIPQNTCYRIFKGEASLDNITLKNAELLNKFYEEMVKMAKIKLNEMEQVKELIHERTNNVFRDGADARYVTLYEGLGDFIEQCGGLQDDETRAEAFERITHGEEWARLNIDSEQPFIAYDDANASASHWFLTKTDEQSIEDFIYKITR